MNDRTQLACPACSWTTICGPAASLQWLAQARMTRRGAEVDPELIGELLRAAAGRLACPQCSHVSLVAQPWSDNDVEGDDEAWGMARKCAQCRQPIARERLEAFPDARLCVACQSTDECGEASGPDEYCPRCGNVMTLRQTRSAGITRYVLSCPKCRR